ncbi:MAG TPA: hypothetical protein VF551_05895, partial [Chthoniobacterales bacterium]
LGDRVTSFANTRTQLARELERVGVADVFLHYAGRAFQRFGFPFWMVAALREWKRKFPTGRLVVYFHELPGEFPVSSRHHWLSKVSSAVAARIGGLADVLITNSEHHAAKLRALAGRADIHLIPIGATVAVNPSPATSRARTEFVIFGLPFGRAQTLALFREHIRRWISGGGLTALHLVGPPDDTASDHPLHDFENVIIRHGTLPSDEVAALLGRVGFALTNATEETWSKSTSFMAAVANRCPVVIAQRRPEATPFSFAVSADEVETISEAELQERTARLAQWYEANADWSVTSRKMAALTRHDDG